jgi:hypothetical protein
MTQQRANNQLEEDIDGTNVQVFMGQITLFICGSRG